MQRTMRQGAPKDSNVARMAAHATPVVAAPTYPLLRMTLVAMANLIVSYATLAWIPTLLVEYNQKIDGNGNNNSNSNYNNSSSNTLPSLSWTLISLFVFQTIIGLLQSYLHSSSTPTTVTKDESKKGNTKSSSSSSRSAFSVFNISICIGAAGFAICHLFAVLFGAGIVQLAKETGQLASYLSLLTFYPASFVLGLDFESWQRIYIHNSPQTYTEAAFYCQGMMTIFGAWLGSIVIPLDWDRPWQAWPVPCVLGAFLFYWIGTIVGLVTSIVMRQRTVRKEFGIDVESKTKRDKKKDS